MNHSRLRVCVDFDGTIVEHEFPKIGALKPHVKEVLHKLKKDRNAHIIISSCRNNKEINVDGKYLNEMVEFLDKEGIVYDEIDRGDQGKVFAHVYIDDRAYHFDDWSLVYQQLFREPMPRE